MKNLKRVSAWIMGVAVLAIASFAHAGWEFSAGNKVTSLDDTTITNNYGSHTGDFDKSHLSGSVGYTFGNASGGGFELTAGAMVGGVERHAPLTSGANTDIGNLQTEKAAFNTQLEALDENAADYETEKARLEGEIKARDDSMYAIRSSFQRSDDHQGGFAKAMMWTPKTRFGGQFGGGVEVFKAFNEDDGVVPSLALGYRARQGATQNWGVQGNVYEDAVAFSLAVSTD